MKHWRQHASGISLCLAAAGACAFALHGSPIADFLPLLFLIIVSLSAAKFGSAAGILGTIGAAFIFGEFLFQSSLGLRAGDPIARNNLIWMIIMGIVISGLLGVPPNSRRAHGRNHTAGI